MSSEVIAAQPVVPASSPRRVEGLVRLRNGDKSLSPVFVCPELTGDVLTAIRLSRLLTGDRPILGFRARTGPDGAPLDLTMADMAASVVERIQAVQPAGDYELVGYSYGANLAYEAGRLLQQAGHRVRVAMLDPYVSHHCLTGAAKWRFHLAGRPWAIARWLVRSDWGVRRRFAQRLVHRFAPWTGVGPPPPEGEKRTDQEQRMAAVGVVAFRHYRPGRLSAPTLIIATRERFADFCDPFPVLLKSIDAGQASVVWMDGDHEQMVREPHVHETAVLLDRWFEQSPAAA